MQGMASVFWTVDDVHVPMLRKLPYGFDVVGKELGEDPNSRSYQANASA
jgi:hypothetical protein